MSILSELLGDVASLFFSSACPVCGEPFRTGEQGVCSFCRATAPLTGFWHEACNPVFRKFEGLVPLERASGFLYYLHDSGWRRAIHSFKYRGAWRTARALGDWYGHALAESGLYGTVDAVVPLPLHPLRLLRRGYNQSEHLAAGIAAQLGVPLDSRSVRRCRHTKKQALRSRCERPGNVAGAFAVRRPERLAGKHLLLVDDVLTTGSTLASCAEAILRAVPDCRLSVAALAVSYRETGPRG